MKKTDLPGIIPVIVNVQNIKKINEISELLIPNSPGLYCMRIVFVDKLPLEYAKILDKREHNILYIGTTRKSLKDEFYNNELMAKGPGEFFNLLGIILGYSPLKHSYSEKYGKLLFRFSDFDSGKIADWIEENIVVNFAEYGGDLETAEKTLIEKYIPLMNIRNNPEPVKELEALHKIAIRAAK